MKLQQLVVCTTVLFLVGCGSSDSVTQASGPLSEDTDESRFTEGGEANLFPNVTIPQCPNLECDDGNPCTVDDCDEDKGCLHTPNEDGTACDDGDESEERR